MTDSDVARFEEISRTSCHPQYDKLTGDERDYLFASRYGKLAAARPGLPRWAYYLRALSSPESFRGHKDARHFRKARLVADYHGARYEDYLTAIFEWYEDLHRVKPEKFKMPAPPPRNLYGDGARENYVAWIGRTHSIPFGRDGVDPELLPENYTGSEWQVRYYSRMLDSIEQVAAATKVTRDESISLAITEGIMSRRFMDEYGHDRPGGERAA